MPDTLHLLKKHFITLDMNLTDNRTSNIKPLTRHGTEIQMKREKLHGYQHLQSPIQTIEIIRHVKNESFLPTDARRSLIFNHVSNANTDTTVPRKDGGL